MNIFWLSMDPEQCAQMHCDKHVVKMPLEMVQMLCTTHWQHGNEAPYMPVHPKHPCTIWVGQTVDNYRLAWRIGYHLFKEYTYRYGKVHKSESVLYAVRCAPPALKARGVTTLPQAMPEQYKHHDVMVAYRDYYRGEKSEFCKWTNRPIPDFMLDLCA
jgi:hypothetical protein